MMIWQKIKRDCSLYKGYRKPGLIYRCWERGVRKEVWLLFVRNAGLRPSMTNPGSATCVVQHCPRILKKKPENIVRSAQQKFLTAMRFPVPRVVLSFLQKSLMSHRSVPRGYAPSVVTRLLMRADIIVIPAGRTFGIQQEIYLLQTKLPVKKQGLNNRSLFRGST